MSALQLTLILNFLELSACITAFFYWNKIKNSHWKYFAFYLALIVITELTAEYFLHCLKDLKTNAQIYRYWGLPLQFFFFFWLYYQYLKDGKNRYLPLVSGLIYLSCWFIDQNYFIGLFPWFDSFSYSVGCILLLILLLAYVFQLTSAGELFSFKSNMMLMVNLGILLFYIGTLPYWGFKGVMYENYQDLFSVYYVIQFILNYMMYLIFTMAFIWGRQK